MNDLTFLKLQSVQLRQLLDRAGEGSVTHMQLAVRLEAIENRLAEANKLPGNLFTKETIDLPRAALFLRGSLVQGSEGIRPSLAGHALIQYEGMFVEQALHDEREAAKADGRQRRPRGAPLPKLLFTGTPRGSFGLEFTPQIPEDASFAYLHAQSLENVANALTRVAENDSEDVNTTLSNIPQRVIPYLKRFFSELAKCDAELRLAFSNKPSTMLGSENIKKAAERLDRQVVVDDISIDGVFRGVTRETGHFDLRPNEGMVISGFIADELTEEDVERIDKLTNKPCKSRIERTTITKIPGSVNYTYVLLDAVLNSPESTNGGINTVNF